MLRSSWPTQNKFNMFLCAFVVAAVVIDLWMLEAVDFLNVFLREKKKQEIVWVGKYRRSGKTLGRRKNTIKIHFVKKN